MRPQASRIDDLLQAHLRGRPGAGDALTRALRPCMLAAARRRLGAFDPETEDVVQESLVAILAYCEELGGFEGNLEAFAYRVVSNRCLDLIRRRSRRERRELEEGSPPLPADDQLAALIAREELELLARAFAQLDEECRKLLIDNYFEGRSVKAITRRLGRSNVQFTYYRRRGCLEKLGRFLRLLDRDVD